MPNFYEQPGDTGPKSSRDTPSSHIEDQAEDETDTKFRNRRLAQSQMNLAAPKNFGNVQSET